MVEDYKDISIRILEVESFSALVKCIRTSKNIEIISIKSSFEQNAPIKLFQLYGLDHDELEKKLWNLFECFERKSITFEIIFDNEVISKDFFRNLMESWKEIGEETEIQTELEMGFSQIEN